MKHSWANASPLPGYTSRAICRNCGIERRGTIVGNWNVMKYYNGGTLYPHRPDCRLKEVKAE